MGIRVDDDSDLSGRVELWAAKLPLVGLVAWHYWLIVDRGECYDRWEVWQTKGLTTNSWGYLYRNLGDRSAGVGNGEGWRIETWSGDRGQCLAGRIERSPTEYPWRDHYFVFPGPNSNTYVQWVLREHYQLSWHGIGRRYVRHAAKAKA